MRFPIFFPFWQILLAGLCVSLVACGSVANRAVSGAGGTPGADDAGAGGAIGSDASATGGAGGTGLGDAGLGDAGPSDGPGIGVRGGISPFGIVSPSTGATIRITRQRFGPAPVCAGNVCVSGGLSPQ
jgi:hypothetical protein